MIKLEEMSTSVLNEIVSRIEYDIETIMNAGDEAAWERLGHLQMTADAIIAELGDRDAASKWAAEQKAYAEAMASAQSSFEVIYGVTLEQAYEILEKRGIDLNDTYIEGHLTFDGPGKTTFSTEDPAVYDVDIGQWEGGVLTLYPTN